MKSFYLYIPINSYFNYYNKQELELFAPCHINPNFVRSSRHRDYTISKPVIQIVGVYFRVSNFSLSGMKKTIYFNNKDHASHFATL